ncbi:MAG TPA: hypothetical protein VK191_00990 [Symbiobacteriaceae bacterium]|nr:hypothetical protein [Symbiobacteriaceae bacterium]
MSNLHYRFLPWVREGLAGLIPAANTAPQPTLTVEMGVGGATASAQVRLYGPGEVTAIDPHAIIRQEPRPGTADFEPTYFAALEFDRPDFPWLFSPQAPANGRLTPWLTLVVLPERAGIDLTNVPGQSLPVLTITQNAHLELPDLREAWAWAHAQALGDLSAADVTNELKSQSERTASRLFAPRKLAAKTAYIACLVPSFEVGRLAGLGLDPSTVTDLRFAWDVTKGAALGTVTLPVYHHWRFATGEGGDFDRLVRRLVPRPLGAAVGTRPLDVSAPGAGLPSAAASMAIEGALQSDQTEPSDWSPEEQAEFQLALRALLNRVSTGVGRDPIAGPPIWAGLQAGRSRLSGDGLDPLWLAELNLDPRLRAAAGLGALVVQTEQEQLMAAAWEQLGEHRRTNQRLRQAQLARATSGHLLAKQVAGLKSGHLLQLLQGLHGELAAALNAPNSIAERAAGSYLPDGLFSPAMQRLYRPRGPLGKRLLPKGERFVRPVVERLNQRKVKVAPPRTAPAGTVTVDGLSKSFSHRYTTLRFSRLTAKAIATAGGFRSSSPITPPEGTVKASFTATAPESDAKLSMMMLPERDRWDERDWAETDIPEPPAPPVDPALLEQMNANFAAAASATQTYLLTHWSNPAQPRRRPMGTLGIPSIVGQQLQAEPLIVEALQAEGIAPAEAWERHDPLEPLAFIPRFDTPMHQPLAALSTEWILPGMGTVPAESISLLKPNARFVEAYMAGLNHELARELLCREFPAPQDATYFASFWSSRAEIEDLDGWDRTSKLGQHRHPATQPMRAVLLLRGALVRRYPRAAIYAAKAILGPDGKRVPGATVKLPLFRSTLEPDVLLVGFDLTDDDLRGTADGLGWYVVIQDQPAEPRFGLTPEQAADATHFGGAVNLTGLSWSPTGAHLAAELFRRPVRVSIHASRLLPPEE